MESFLYLMKMYFCHSKHSNEVWMDIRYLDVHVC